jgi:hypothetical protein
MICSIVDADGRMSNNRLDHLRVLGKISVSAATIATISPWKKSS